MVAAGRWEERKRRVTGEGREWEMYATCRGKKKKNSGEERNANGGKTL